MRCSSPATRSPRGASSAKPSERRSPERPFVFLVSPESVEPGSYCLTELGFARERWPKPADRVLPVVVAATPPESFPPDISEPLGALPTGNVSQRKWWRASRRSRGSAGALGLRPPPLRSRRSSRWSALGRRSGADAIPSLGLFLCRRGRESSPGGRRHARPGRGPRPRRESFASYRQHHRRGARAGGRSGGTPARLHTDPPRRKRRPELLRMVPGLREGRQPGYPTPVARLHPARGRARPDLWRSGRNGTPVRSSAPHPWLRSSGAARGSLPRPPPAFSIGLASPHQLLVQSSRGDSARVVPLPGEPTAIAAREIVSRSGPARPA